MHRSTRFVGPGTSSRALFLAAAALLIAAPAWSDVTIRERTVTTGLMGFGNGTGERTTVIAGDKSRTDESHTYTGRFQSLAGGGKPQTSASITRLDRELIWQLQPDRKEYTELTFAEMRAMMDESAERARAHGSQNAEMQYKVDVQRTGKRDKVNGFAAEEVIITVTATTTAKGKGNDNGAAGQPVTVFTMKMDEWLASNVPGSDEAQAYYRQFADKMGLDPQLQGMATGMMAQYGDALKQMAAKMKDLKGYPVRTTLTMTMGAPMTPEQQAQMQKSHADADNAQAQNQQQQDQAAHDNAAGAAASGNLGGALGGLLGHRMGKAAQHKAESGTSSGADNSGGPPGGMTVTIDVISVTTGAAGASFDVPSDYKKVAGRSRH